MAEHLREQAVEVRFDAVRVAGYHEHDIISLGGNAGIFLPLPGGFRIERAAGSLAIPCLVVNPGLENLLYGVGVLAVFHLSQGQFSGGGGNSGGGDQALIQLQIQQDGIEILS